MTAGPWVWIQDHYIEPLWLTAAFSCFSFPKLYYCAHKIAFDATIAIGYCASCKNSESFFKTNLAFQEILWTRQSVQFHSLSKDGIAYGRENAGNRTLNLKMHSLPVGYKVRLFHPHRQVEIVRLFPVQPERYRALSRCPSDSAGHFSKACYLIKCIIHYSPSPMI